MFLPILQIRSLKPDKNQFEKLPHSGVKRVKECRFICKSYLPCINFFFFLGVHKIKSDEKQPTYLKQSEFLLDKTHFMN